MASNMLGFGKPSAAVGGTDFSTNANDVNSGFEQVTPKDPVPVMPDADDGGTAPGMSFNCDQDITGPNGFNLGGSAQNIMTDVNRAGMGGGSSPSYGPFTPDNIKGGGTGDDDKGLNASGDAESKA